MAEIGHCIHASHHPRDPGEAPPGFLVANEILHVHGYKNQVFSLQPKEVRLSAHTLEVGLGLGGQRLQITFFARHKYTNPAAVFFSLA